MAERPDISMTDDEARALLGRAGELVVAAIGPGGWPVATLAPGRLDDGGILVDVGGDDVVAGSLVDGAAVCCVADEAPSYFEIKGVIARGRVAGVRSDGDVLRAGVRVERVVSFDFAKLPEASPS